jgi:membrane protein implicated in regulation of membrane protease activity
MNAPEGLDIRAPIGGLFGVLGLMLVLYGLVASGSGGPSDLSSGTNVNLWWGLVMLAFGVIMLLLARRAMSRTAATPQG